VAIFIIIGSKLPPSAKTERLSCAANNASLDADPKRHIHTDANPPKGCAPLCERWKKQPAGPAGEAPEDPADFY